MSSRILFIAFFLVLAAAFSVCAEIRITIANLNWEPCSGPELKNNGLIKNAFIIKGYSPEIVYLPLAMAVKMAGSGYFEAYALDRFRNKAGEIEFMEPQREKYIPLYMCVLRKTPEASKTIEYFNDGNKISP